MVLRFTRLQFTQAHQLPTATCRPAQLFHVARTCCCPARTVWLPCHASRTLHLHTLPPRMPQHIDARPCNGLTHNKRRPSWFLQQHYIGLSTIFCLLYFHYLNFTAIWDIVAIVGQGQMYMDRMWLLYTIKLGPKNELSGRTKS